MTTVLLKRQKKRAVIDSAIIFTHQHRGCFVRSADGYATLYSDCMESKNPHARRKYQRRTMKI